MVNQTTNTAREEISDDDLKSAKAHIEKIMKQRFKPSKWEGFKDFVGVFSLFIFGILVLLGIIYLFITLVENPVSLAIICATIFLFWAWSTR